MRAERERARFRLHLHRHWTAFKNRIHATLLAFGKPCPVSDLFGVGGRALLAGLTGRRVDLLRGTVEVTEIVTEVEGVVSVGQPKTRASRRTVGLLRRVVAELDQHLAACTAAGPTAPVFPAPLGGPLRVTGFRGRVWRPATVAAGLDGLKVHELRHTAVALWIAAGASPKEVATRAGHTSVKTVLDVYGGLYPEADTALRDRLDAMYTDAAEGQVLTLDRSASGPKVVPDSR